MATHSSRNVFGDDLLLAASPNSEACSSADGFDVQVLSFVADCQGNRIGFCDLALRLVGGQRLVVRRCSVHLCGSLWVTFPAERTGPGKDHYRNSIQFPDRADQKQFTAAVALALAPLIEKAGAQ